MSVRDMSAGGVFGHLMSNLVGAQELEQIKNRQLETYGLVASASRLEHEVSLTCELLSRS